MISAGFCVSAYYRNSLLVLNTSLAVTTTSQEESDSMTDVPDIVAHLQAENARLHQHIATLQQTTRMMDQTITDLEKRIADCMSELYIFRMLVESAPESIFITGTDRIITYANQAGRELTGYGDALIGMHTEEMYAEQPETIAAMRHALATEGLWRGDILYRHRDGHLLTLQVVIFMINDANSEIQVVAGIGHDITAQQQIETSRRQLEAELRHQQQFLRQVLDINPNLIFTRNRTGQFTLVNQTLSTIYGTPVEDLLGKTDADLGLDATGIMQLRQEDNQVLTTGAEIVVPERWIRDATGQDRCISLVKRPIHAPDGSIDQVLVVATDITISKLAEEALEQINDDLIQLVRELEHRNYEVALLNEMGHFFLRSGTVQEIYDAIAGFATSLFGGRSGGLYMYAPDNQHLMAMAVWGDPPPALRTLLVDECQAIKHGRTYPADRFDIAQNCGTPGDSYEAGYVCVPIIDQGETLGIFRQHLASHSSPERSIQLAENITRYIGMTLTNLRLRARLREQAIRDPLTRLFNRRYLDESLERELSTAARQQISIGLMMIDIDHFKKINDTCGHKAGDAVLATLGGYLQENVRGGDIACRYGGEEFVLVLPGASLEDTRQRAEALREDVWQFNIEYAGQQIWPITISIGVAMYPEHGRTPDTLLRAADEALYRAKTSGRNRVVVAEPITD